jgi:hypothetical protein
MAICPELQLWTRMPWRRFTDYTDYNNEVVTTLVCGGSNLLHTSDMHQYWVREKVNLVSAKVIILIILYICIAPHSKKIALWRFTENKGK